MRRLAFTKSINQWDNISGNKNNVRGKTEPYLDDLLIGLFQKYVNSWFKRHKSNLFMKMGILNGESMLKKLRQEPFVSDVFEVGLSADKTHRCLGLSSDKNSLMKEEEKGD